MPVLDTELERRAAYAKAFGRAAIAFVFTMVDIRIGSEGRSFDVVPDVVGYALFLGAAKVLEQLHSAAPTVRTQAAILTAVSLIVLLIELAPNAGALMLPVGLAMLALDLLMVWRLCGIVIDVAQHLARPKLAEAAENRRRLYVAFTVFVATVPLLVITFAGSDLSGIVAVVLFAAFIAAIVLVIQMYGLMRVTERVVTVD